jgi:hypothetical protein
MVYDKWVSGVGVCRIYRDAEICCFGCVHFILV